jgi:site-specific DNA recombinase
LELVPAAKLTRQNVRYEQEERLIFKVEAAGTTGSYSRYSSSNQSELSNADQQRKQQELAERNGHKILPKLEFADAAVSGTKLSRDDLDRMLLAAEAGAFNVLYLYSLSRLARESILTMPMMKKLVYSLGIRVITVVEGIDTARDGWELITSIIAVMHEQFLKDLAASVVRGQEGIVLAGLCVGDYRFGFKSVPVLDMEALQSRGAARPKKMYVIDEETAPWVVRIFHWFVVERRTLRWITRELNLRNAPKDHRSTTPKWHHTLVAGVLESPKYTGVWPWGEMENVRDPFTGKVHQEPRPEEECAKWIRYFPKLRLIQDDIFAKAQQRLQENYEKYAARRRSNGTLKAAREADGSLVPRHLLSGIVQCAICKSTFIVSGTGGKYLSCTGYPKGICSCKTQLRRDRAERMILHEIGKRIAGNPAWREAVYQQLVKRYRDEERQIPTELATVEKAIGEIDGKIGYIIDRIEAGLNDPDVDQRLQQHRQNRHDFVRRRDDLLRSEETRMPEPTIEWLQKQLDNLGVCLRETTPAAAYALRDLVGGRIIVREIPREGRKRCQMRGEFTLTVGAVAAAVAGTSLATESEEFDGAGTFTEHIIIDFVDPNPLDAKAAKAKELYDQGMLHCDIHEELKCSASRLTKLLKHAFKLLGQPFPDGRGRRSELAKKQTEPPLYQRIADEVFQLYATDLYLDEIAGRLKVDPNTVTKALGYAHEVRGLPVPDGRSRRYQLPRRDDAADRGGNGSSEPRDAA